MLCFFFLPFSFPTESCDLSRQVARRLRDILKSQRKKRGKKSQVGISVFLNTVPFIFPVKPLGPETVSPLPPKLCGCSHNDAC